MNADSFAVTVDDQTVAANTFTYAAGQNGAFTLTCDNVKDIPGITEDSVIVVTYTATLNAGAVIAGAGNSNTVYLAYSNDPYSDSTATTAVDTVTVYTYKVTVNKTDGTAPLAGAEFKLEKLVKDGDGTKYVELAAPTINHGTEFVWTGLDAGTYRLTETKAPAGYNQVDPEIITITTDNAQREVVNSTGSVLPETGAEGTFFLITGGTLLVIVAAVFMITRKKMSIYED